jgi:hypothetical protein
MNPNYQSTQIVEEEIEKKYSITKKDHKKSKSTGLTRKTLDSDHEIEISS